MQNKINLQWEEQLHKLIEEVVRTTSKNYDFEMTARILISDRQIEVCLTNHKPSNSAKLYWDCIIELSQKIGEKVADKGYFCDKWERQEYDTVLIFQKVEKGKTLLKKKGEELQNFIKNEINSAYAEYNQVSTAKVEVKENEIEIWFDSERPYLGKQFWQLLDTVEKSIKERLNSEGLIYKQTQVLYDFIIWTYKINIVR